jgi:GNAT superfamily N-acetyltransferase
MSEHAGHSTPVRALLRDAVPSDAGAVSQLLGELGYPCTREEAAIRVGQMALDDSQSLIVADAHGDIRGLLALDFMFYLPLGRTTCRITALIVGAAHRGSGIGRELVREAESRARRHGAARIEVVSADHREAAHAFYRNCGYADTSMRFVKRLGDA